jgi:hypothetical protein
MALPRLIIPTPCPVEWDTMKGDARVRRCPSCNKNVYNVTLLKRRELDQLIAMSEGPLPCVRAFRRPDGTIVTRDCLVPVLRAATWLRLKVAVVAGFLLAVWSDVALARVRPLLLRSTPLAAAPADAPSKSKKPAKPTPAPRKPRQPKREPSPANGGMVIE